MGIQYHIKVNILKTFLQQSYLEKPEVLTAKKKPYHFFFLFYENCPFNLEQKFKKFSKKHQVVVKFR